MTEPSATSETIRFPVEGMTCASCVSRITRALRRLDGVSKVTVDLRRQTATVRRMPSLVSNEALAAAVADAGYGADLAVATPVAPQDSHGMVARLLARLR